MLRGITAFAIFAITMSAFAKPNVLIILSDDQSAPHLGCYGNPDIKTPNIDKLATEGMRFERAYQACPQCVPARAAMLTGRPPLDVGMTRFSAGLPREVKIYPESLRADAGYFTGLCGRTYHLDGRGYYNPGIAKYLRPEDKPDMQSRLDYVKIANGDPPVLRPQTIQQFQEFLDKAPKDKPFFLQLCWSDPHRPLTDEQLPVHHDPATLHLPPFYPDDPAIRKDLAAYY